MARATAKKVRGEGHWIAMMDGRPCTNHKHDTQWAALLEARASLVAHFYLEPGEERLVSDIARELEVPRSLVESIPDDREGYHLHVGDQAGGAAWARPRREYTLFRDLED
ncbi:hypothetical protein FDH38_gp121 [Dinoroseobacter phage vB_DshS-R5C]|uniref:Uncharacterized protein n=1 Tax=Dinoroseobacter phage vB_DshS-R5C TaxID=1965368 RepID=A0A1V0DYF1_9CAUD|nr:hypothetical protein FDH38_gp121 [Dinoroseobacter phage vB_DshS-R5C]ARB06175.1 hypothetical protein vBDshSR5C_121 [Dinoroseobacter phage vB_DshS-R5C]